MADALIIGLRNSVADWLRSGTYPYPFSVQTLNLSPIDLQATNDTIVYVYPDPTTGRSLPVYTRAGFQRNYRVYAHLVNFIDSRKMQEMERAMHLVELLEDRLWSEPQEEFEFRQFQSSTSEAPWFEVERASSMNTFHALIGCEYTYAG